MSSTRRGSTRDQLDRYYTPDKLAESCVNVLPFELTNTGKVAEPSVGGGAFLRAVRKRWPGASVDGYDVDPDAKGQHDCTRFFCLDWPQATDTYDLILGNPPYFAAQEHIEHAWTRLAENGHIAMLLRLAFTEGKVRKPFWKKFGPTLRSLHVLAERPSFTTKGTDSAAYGWFVWGKTDTASSQFVPCWSWK